MSTQGRIKQYVIVLHSLKQEGPLSAKELMCRLEDEGFTISKRTFLRIVEELRYEFGVELVYEAEANKYYVATVSAYNEAHVDALLRLLKYAQFTEFVSGIFKNPAKGLKAVSIQSSELLSGVDLLPELFGAITKQQMITFEHENYQNDTLKSYTVYPYMLKEYLYRWYLVGNTPESSDPRIFGIDRINDLKISEDSFELDKNFPYNQLFKDVIGLNYADGVRQKVRLRFSEQQVKYIISFPIHASQKVVQKPDGLWEVSVNLIINFELIQKILQWGDAVEVLAPAELRNQIKELLQRNLQKYL